MRINKVRAWQPATPGSPADWRTQLGQIVIEITTEDGLSGIGVGGGGLAGVHLVEQVFPDVLLGRDAGDVEALHAALVEHTTFYRGGLVWMALSGVDLALWDLRGKAAGKSVARLLNADVTLPQRMPMYATVFDDRATAEALASGFEAVKLHVERFGDRPAARPIAELVQRVREELGPKRPLMVDAFARWDVATTLAVADAIAEFDLGWIEEPLPPDDLAGYAELARRSPLPIAGGEHAYGEAAFRRLLDDGLLAVLQPDINWCGGLTTLREIYRLASDAGIRVCPHRGSEAFAVHALAALDPAPLAESGRTWFAAIEGGGSLDVPGTVELVERPGFGVSLASGSRPS